MEASPPLSNAGPRKKTQTKVASEQVLAWSGLPVVIIRPTVFLEGFFLPLTGPSVRYRGRIELPFGRGQTSPVATADVARVVAAVLADPGPHLGRIYELTGPRSQDVHGVAREYSDALNREVTYSDIPPEDWERELKREGLPEHLTRHLVTMAELHRAGRYDRLADGVERVTGRPAMSVREFVSLHADEFGGRRSYVEFIDEHLSLPHVGLIGRSNFGSNYFGVADRRARALTPPPRSAH
jgi:nucleoside-diphosphate-sugar epimerase